MKKNVKRKTSSTIVSKLITVVAIAVFIYASYGLIDVFLQSKKNEKIANEVRQIYYNDSQRVLAATKKSFEVEEETRPNFEELLKINSDVVGWIKIEDTNIDYPIMQTNNNTDYLQRSFYKNYLPMGSLFLDYRNDLESEDERNLIVYGHRVRDGSMFEHLTKYFDEDFYNSHRTFSFDTLYEEYEAEVFAVYKTMIDFNYIETDFSSKEEFEQMLSEIKERSIYEVDIDVSADDLILTLSTCEYSLHPDDSRLVVHAKLTKK